MKPLKLLPLFLLICRLGFCVETVKPDAGPTEYAILPILALANLAFLDAAPPEQARWKGGILFDDEARERLRIKTKGGRKLASLIGDGLLAAVVAYPILVDGIADTWMKKREMSTAAHLSLIAAQSYLITGLLRTVSKTLAGRERPFQTECAGDPNYDDSCNEESSRTSFFSGHAALSFTGAGLICAAHQSLELAGGSFPCYAALGVATFVSATRIMADKHYLSDTLVGAAVGLASGYLTPRLLHYHESGVVAVPMSGNRLGLSISATW